MAMLTEVPASFPSSTFAPKESAYEALIELLARGGGSEAIIAYHSPDSVQDRAYALVQKKRDGVLTETEAKELYAHSEREHIIRMAKIRARLLLREREPSELAGNVR